MYSDRENKVRVAVYFDEGDWNKVERKMKLSKLTNRSTFIRKMALEGDVVVYDFKAVNELLGAINKIGTNVNQIAKKAHELQNIYQSDVTILKQEYENLCHMLNQFLLNLPKSKL